MKIKNNTIGIGKVIVALFVCMLFLPSCTSRKHLVYLKNIEEQKGEQTYRLKTIERKLEKGDIVYLKILSTNNDLNDLFNPADLDGASGSNFMSAYLKGFTINDSGNITMPIIKTIYIAGLTLIEAEKKIQAKVDEYLNSTVLIIKVLSFRVNILGEVNSPGTQEVFQDKMNILEAIARAGDIKETGDKKNILVLRQFGDDMISYTVDLTNDSILSSDKFQVLPNDVIIVQPLKLKSFRLNAPAISVIFSAITTLLLVVNFVSK